MGKVRSRYARRPNIGVAIAKEGTTLANCLQWSGINASAKARIPSRWRRHVLLIANILRDTPRRHPVTTSAISRRLCRKHRGPPPFHLHINLKLPPNLDTAPPRHRLTRPVEQNTLIAAQINALVTSDLSCCLPYISASAARRIAL